MFVKLLKRKPVLFKTLGLLENNRELGDVISISLSVNCLSVWFETSSYIRKTGMIVTTLFYSIQSNVRDFCCVSSFVCMYVM